MKNRYPVAATALAILALGSVVVLRHPQAWRQPAQAARNPGKPQSVFPRARPAETRKATANARPCDGTVLTDLDLSRPPSQAELVAAGGLDGPLCPTAPCDPAGTADQTERARLGRINLSFGTATSAWNRHRPAEACGLFKAHLADFPGSPWAAECHLHLGVNSMRTGLHEEALERFRLAADAAPEGSPVRYKARMQTAIVLGCGDRKADASALFAEIHRTDPDPMRRTLASRWIMRLAGKGAGVARAGDCGLKALARVSGIPGAESRLADVLADPGEQGFSIGDLAAAATVLGLPARAVSGCSDPGDLPVPFVAHYRSNHFVAVEAAGRDEVTVLDPRFGKAVTVGREEFLGEWSGSAIVTREGPLPSTASVLADSGSVAGASTTIPWIVFPGLGLDDDDDNPCSMCCTVTVWKINTASMNFRMSERPMWWSPPFGQEVNMRLTFNSLDTKAGIEPFGEKWSFSYASWLEVVGNIGIIVREGDGRSTFFAEPESGQVLMSPAGEFRTLTRTGTDAYEMEDQDGTVTAFGIPPAMQNGTVPMLLSITDRHGNVVGVVHNGQGAITGLTHSALPPNTGWTLDYTTITLPDNQTTVSRVASITDPFGRACSFEYDGNGNLTKTVNMGGAGSSYTYTLKPGETGGARTPAGGVLPVRPELFIESLHTGRGTTVFTTEPADGGQVDEEDRSYPPQDGPMGAAYRIRATDPLENTEEYHFDPVAGRTIHRDATQYDDQTTAAAIDADEFSGTEWFPSPLADARSMIPVKRLRDGPSATVQVRKRTAYDTASLLPSEIENVFGKTTSVVRNAKGKVTSITLPPPSGYTGTDNIIGMEYAANGLDLVEVTRTLDEETQTLASFTYYQNRDLHTATDALGRTLTYEWHTNGLPDTVTDSVTGDVVEFVYDEQTTWRPSGVKLNGNPLSASATVDLRGRMLASTDSSGDMTEFTYDDLDRMVSATGGDGFVRRWVRSCCGVEEEKVSRQTQGGEVLLARTLYGHDARGLVTSVRDTSGLLTRFTHDAAGRMATLVDPAGNTTAWSYDGAGLLEAKTYADQTAESYTWLDPDHMATRTNRRGQTISFDYNEENLALSRMAYDIEGPNELFLEYAYDTWNRLAGVSSGSSSPQTHAFTYDLLGRMTSLDGPWDEDTISWTYDDADREVTREVEGAAGTVTETTTGDAMGRVALSVNPLGTFEPEYDGESDRVTQVTHSGGFDTVLEYFGEAGSRALQSILSKKPGGNTVASHEYTYDSLGRIATWEREAPLASPGTTHEFQWTLSHDFSSRLTGVVEKSLTGTLRDGWTFGYDAVGNRFSSVRSGAPGGIATAMTATHDNMNRIASLGGGGRTLVSGTLSEPGIASVGLAGQGERPARMRPGNRFEAEIDLPAGPSTLAVEAADESGNRSSYLYSVSTDPQASRSFTYDDDGNLTSDGIRSFEWDVLSRLKTITWATGKATEFTYNAIGQRAKVVETDGSQSTTRYYLYDGADLVERRTGSDPDTATADRVYFAQGEQRRTGSAWVAYHYCRDHLGSVREVLDDDGTLVARYDYTPYGERIARYVDSSYGSCDFGFTGHITIPSLATGQGEIVLAFYRAYDPVLAVWLSEDPLGLEGGINLYAYVLGMPCRFRDLLGLEPAVDVAITNAEVQKLLAKFGQSRITTVATLGKCATGRKVLKFMARDDVKIVSIKAGEKAYIEPGEKGTLNLPLDSIEHTIVHEAQHLSEGVLGITNVFADVCYSGDKEFSEKVAYSDYSCEYRAERVVNQVRKELFPRSAPIRSYFDYGTRVPLPPGTEYPKPNK